MNAITTIDVVRQSITFRSALSQARLCLILEDLEFLTGSIYFMSLSAIKTIKLSIVRAEKRNKKSKVPVGKD